MSALASVSAGRRTRADLAGDLAQLYIQKTPRSEIAKALDLTRTQVHKLLTELFAEGMPKLKWRSLDEETARAIHAAYRLGGAPINRRAMMLGISPTTVRRKWRRLGLSTNRQKVPRNPAKTPAQAEQRMITALFMARVEERRKARGLTVEHLARACDVSLSTLQVLRGELTDPHLSTVLRVCSGLDVTPGELLDNLPRPVEPRLRRGQEVGRRDHQQGDRPGKARAKPHEKAAQ